MFISKNGVCAYWIWKKRVCEGHEKDDLGSRPGLDQNGKKWKWLLFLWAHILEVKQDMNIQCPPCVPYKNASRDLVEENWAKEGRIRGQNAEMINPNVRKNNLAFFTGLWMRNKPCGRVLSWVSNLEPSRLCVCILEYVFGRFIWKDLTQNSLEDGHINMHAQEQRKHSKNHNWREWNNEEMCSQWVQFSLWSNSVTNLLTRLNE